MVWPSPLKVPMYGWPSVPIENQSPTPLRLISAIRMAQRSVAPRLSSPSTSPENFSSCSAVAIWYGSFAVPLPPANWLSPLSDCWETVPPISKRRGERQARDKEQRCQEHAQDAARCFVYHLSSSFPLVVFIRFIIPYCQAEILTNFALFRPVLHGFGFFGRSTGFQPPGSSRQPISLRICSTSFRGMLDFSGRPRPGAISQSSCACRLALLDSARQFCTV